MSLIDVAPAVCRWLSLDCADLGPVATLAEAKRPDADPGRGDALAHLTHGRSGAERAWVGHLSKAIEHPDGRIEVFVPPAYPTSDRELVEEFSRDELPLASRQAADTVQAMDERVVEAQRKGALLRGPVPHPTVAIDEETRKHLQALGYLPDGDGSR